MITIEQIYNLYRESSGVTTDSRSITEGSLFFALRGESFDGNKYAAEALAKGAAYSIVDSQEVYKIVDDERVILVDDVLETLQKLARHHRTHTAHRDSSYHRIKWKDNNQGVTSRGAET